MNKPEDAASPPTQHETGNAKMMYLMTLSKMQQLSEKIDKSIAEITNSPKHKEEKVEPPKKGELR